MGEVTLGRGMFVVALIGFWGVFVVALISGNAVDLVALLIAISVKITGVAMMVTEGQEKSK